MALCDNAAIGWYHQRLEEACHDFGYVNIYVHFGARCLESDRDFRRGHRPVWHVQLEKTQWLDRALSRKHGVNERDRVLLSAGSLVASHIVGIRSLVVLAVAILALYV
jgi:hypothetical protein